MPRNQGGGLPPTDERLADPDVEGLIEEASSPEVPDDERVVPEDVEDYVHDDTADPEA